MRDNETNEDWDVNLQFDIYVERATKICNETVLSKPPPADGLYCPPAIDGWGTCINYTKAGTTAYAPCPDIFYFNRNAKAYRHCEANGTWQIIASVGRPWTNHSACTQNVSLPGGITEDDSVSYLYLYFAGASLSLVFLVISLAIFYGFRQLQCDRVTIHKNLFISYVLSALAWILYYRLVVLDGDVLLRNPVWCQILHVVAHYSTNTNFAWMFCEGLYLHIIMAHALRTGKKLLKSLVIGGWGVPFVLTAIYAAVRGSLHPANTSCWMMDDVLLWIFAAPVSASVIINICILVNLVRLLMTKLRQIPDAAQSRKAAKATLILVPLFGLHFLLFPVRPDKDSPLHLFYLHFMALLMSLQGTLVSIIFCFCNGEVRSLIRRKWHQHRLMSGHARKNTGFTSSTYVDGYSVVDTTRDGTFIRSKIAQDSQHKNNIEVVEMKASPQPTTPLVDKENGKEKASNNMDEIA